MTRRGDKLSPEAIAKRTATRRAKHDGAYSAPGMSITERRDAKRWRQNVTKANRARNLSGPNNPFYGKAHSAETRRRLSEANSGSGSPQWKGGVGTFPYGPEFTKKFKRLIRQRDGNCCQSCKRTHREVGRTLHVHHVDFDPSNNDPANLTALCHSCHRRIHPQVQRRWKR